MAYYSVY